MQAAGSSLPKLNPVRRHLKSSPALGPGDLYAHLECLLGKLGHDEHTVGDRVALGRDPSADLTLVRALGEVGIRHLRSNVPTDALDVDLPLELVPEEGETHLGIEIDLVSLAALVVGVEDKLPLLGDLLQQHRAGAGLTIESSRADDQGCRFYHVELNRLLKPLATLVERVLRHVAVRE